MRAELENRDQGAGMRVRPACAMNVKPLSFMGRRLASDGNTMLHGPPGKSAEGLHHERGFFLEIARPRMSAVFGICLMKEARKYLHHPVLAHDI